MVPERYVPQATAIAFGGATAANVLGIPAGTLIGELTDWRIAFATLGGLGLLVVVTLLLALGSIPLFVGLAFVLPWLGYSTWHLYTRLVDRSGITPG